MGVLRVKIGADWVDIGGAGGEGDEVWVGPNAPTNQAELWYDTDEVAPVGAVVQAGNFVPTWVGLTVGTTGAVNTANYLWIGGPSIGDLGQLTVQGRVVLGAGFSVGGTITMAYPAGFNIANLLHQQDHPVGRNGQRPAAGTAGAYEGSIWANAVDTVRLLLENVGGSFSQPSAFSASTPGVWAAGDPINFQWQVIGKRV